MNAHPGLSEDEVFAMNCGRDVLPRLKHASTRLACAMDEHLQRPHDRATACRAAYWLGAVIGLAGDALRRLQETK